MSDSLIAKEILLLKNGDMNVFRLIFEREYFLLLAFAEKFVDRATAQDFIQDVFIKIWENRESLEIQQSIRPYLFQSIRNRCINHLEHLRVKASFAEKILLEEKIMEVSFFQSPEQIIIQKEQLNNLHASIERLPEKCRRVFKMAYFEDKKSTEIAQVLNLSIRTVETHIYNALKILRKKLKK